MDVTAGTEGTQSLIHAPAYTGNTTAWIPPLSTRAMLRWQNSSQHTLSGCRMHQHTSDRPNSPHNNSSCKIFIVACEGVTGCKQPSKLSVRLCWPHPAPWPSSSSSSWGEQWGFVSTRRNEHYPSTIAFFIPASRHLWLEKEMHSSCTSEEYLLELGFAQNSVCDLQGIDLSMDHSQNILA